MARPTRAGRIMSWMVASTAVLMVVLWATGVMKPMRAWGWGILIVGVQFTLVSLLGISKPRWAGLLSGLGSILMSLRLIHDAGWGVLLQVLGQVLMLVGLLGSLSRPTPMDAPLALTEDMRAKAGLLDESEEHGPELRVILLSPGPKRRKVVGRLRELYDLVGIQRVLSILDGTPSVLQTTTYRREAEFVAAQLAECGAQVDIVEAP